MPTLYRHSPTTRAVLTSLVPVICPPEAVPLAAAIVDELELTYQTIPALLQRALPAGFLAYDLGALPRHRKRARSLTGDSAERYFASWERGPTPFHRQLTNSVNQLMSFVCFEQPAMMERIGYRPAAWIAEVTKKRLTVYADDVRAQQVQILAADPLRPRAKREVA
jgi:hypothetical protein